MCPFSQSLPGVACHKACVAGDMCAAFHPLRTFANKAAALRTGRKECTVCCGRTLDDFIPACSLCEQTTDLSLCTKCASGFLLNQVDSLLLPNGTHTGKAGHTKSVWEETYDWNTGTSTAN